MNIFQPFTLLLSFAFVLVSPLRQQKHRRWRTVEKLMLLVLVKRPGQWQQQCYCRCRSFAWLRTVALVCRRQAAPSFLLRPLCCVTRSLGTRKLVVRACPPSLISGDASLPLSIRISLSLLSLLPDWNTAKAD